jgi:DNA-binding phage protein
MTPSPRTSISAIVAAAADPINDEATRTPAQSLRHRITNRPPGKRLSERYVQAVGQVAREIGVNEVARRAGLPNAMIVSRTVNDRPGVRLENFVCIALACGFSLTIDHPSPAIRKLLDQGK